MSCTLSAFISSYSLYIFLIRPIDSLIFISVRSEWLYFIIFKSIRRLKMILHRDFMIPIINFYRIRDLHRDLRSIPELSGKKKSSSYDFPTYLVLQTHDIVFSSRQSGHSHYVNDQDIIKRRMMKVKSFTLYTFTSRFILKIFVILEEENLSVFISLINEL